MLHSAVWARSGRTTSVASGSSGTSQSGGICGQTSLIVEFTRCYIPADKYKTDRAMDRGHVVFEMLDIASHHEHVRDQWIRESEGFLLCSTFEEPGSIKRVAALYDKILRVKEVESVPVVLVRTQSDLNLSFPDKNVALHWAKKHGAGLISTSKYGRAENAANAFEMIARICVRSAQQKGD